MCGIFAFVQRGRLDSDQLANIVEYFMCIKYRGPDRTSHVILENFDCTIFLGFHRLAIIDTSEKSQPLLQDENVYLVCNGEIYNYRHLIEKYSLPVRTGSDCEVILQLYRHYPQLWPDIINELDGVFAFVLYDNNTGKLWAARDRFGVRPLFLGVGQTPQSATFASEGKAIVQSNAEQVTPGLVQFLAVKHYRWGEDVQWYNPSTRFCAGLEDSREIIKTLFTAAVRKRLMADRPVGFLVSGGLDSSLVAAVAQKMLPDPITTFSIGLQGSPDLKAAATVAAFLGSIHHEIIISTQDIITALEQVVYHCETYDITTIRASIPMYLISKYISEHTDIKVIFSGEGADELFGGYLYFHQAPSPREFQTESVRLLQDLYKYDLLRGDRTTAAWGLELRVPFLDADLVNFVRAIDPQHKSPGGSGGGSEGGGIEKRILRDTFQGYLPDSILYRQKEAFSDGIGYNSVSALVDHAERAAVECDIPHDHVAIPYTAESRLYYNIFRKFYADRPSMYTDYYWMPRWNQVTDPSARVLSQHLSFVNTKNLEQK